ncbi:DUF5317 family protein, partial [Clostridium perfringens]
IGSLFILAGTFLNHIVMAANGGEMPVFPSLSYLTGYLKPNTISKVNDIHMIGTSTVKYKYLSDIIDIGYSVLSIGDILIRVFVVIIIYVTVKKTNEKNEYKQRNIFA